MRPFIILTFALLSFFAGANSFSMASVVKQAEIMKVNSVSGVTNSAITVNTTVRGFAANDPYQVRSHSIPKETYMGHVKSNLGSLVKKNLWYAGWFATMVAAGWAIDELTNQVTQPLTTGRGTCKNTTSQFPINTPNMLLMDCAAAVASMAANSPDKYKFSYSTKGPTFVDLFFVNQWGTTPHPRLAQLQNIQPVTTDNSPVSEDQLYDSLVAQMLQDPEKAAQAFMVPDAWPYPYPQIFPDTVPYIPGVTQSDQELLDLYSQGLLQSTNPNAAHYVSPEKLAEIAALAGQLQQGVTPEAQASAANATLSAPLTQSQLEQVMKKQAAAEAKADAAAVTQAATALAPATAALDKLNEDKADLEGMITDSPSAQPPSSMPDIFRWTLPTGNCQSYPFTFTIKAGSAPADDNGAFCQTYNEVAHPLIFWFLNMLTAIYIFGIWSRTMTSVVGGR